TWRRWSRERRIRGAHRGLHHRGLVAPEGPGPPRGPLRPEGPARHDHRRPPQVARGGERADSSARAAPQHRLAERRHPMKNPIRLVVALDVTDDGEWQAAVEN